MGRIARAYVSFVIVLISCFARSHTGEGESQLRRYIKSACLMGTARARLCSLASVRECAAAMTVAVTLCLLSSHRCCAAKRLALLTPETPRHE